MNDVFSLYRSSRLRSLQITLTMSFQGHTCHEQRSRSILITERYAPLFSAVWARYLFLLPVEVTKPGSLQTEKGTQSILSGGAVAKKVSTPTVESDPGESVRPC